MGIFKRNKPSGILYVSDSIIGEEPNLFLEALEHPNEIAKKRCVTFEVKVIKPNSQK